MSFLPDFSHIFVEREALEYPQAKSIIARFSKANVIQVKNYKEVFNRSNQDWRLQKNSQKLILAVKKSPFLYPGSDVVQNPGVKNFFYNSLVKNCLYDCHYCYLQGMFPSPHLVVYVNLEDYFLATEEALKNLKEIYLSISYDTDLLAIENIVNYCGRWIEFASQNKDITVELRTKSSNYSAIKKYRSISNFILAWTLSPEEIQVKYETKTPSLKARLKAALQAIEDGWPVRLCFDPVIACADWKNIYANFLESVFAVLPGHAIHDTTLGPFRMNSTYFRRAADLRLDSDLIHQPFSTEQKIVSYSEATRAEINGFMSAQINKYLPAAKSVNSYCLQ